MSAAALIPSLLPLVVVAAMRRAEARIRRRFDEARAFDAESAIPLPLDRSIERRRIESLTDRGAVHRTADGLYFLDVEGWDRYRSDRRRRGLVALSVLVAVVGIGIAVLLILQ